MIIKVIKVELFVILISLIFSLIFIQVRKDYLSRMIFFLFSIVIGMFIFLEGISVNYDLLLRPLSTGYNLIEPFSTFAFMLFCLFCLVGVAELLILTSKK